MEKSLAEKKMYIPTVVTVSPDQEEKLKREIRNATAVTVKLQMGGDHTVLLTRAQIGKRHAQHKVAIRFSKKQVGCCKCTTPRWFSWYVGWFSR